MLDENEIERRHYDAAQPFFPCGFSISRRNPGHWDIYAYEPPGRVSAWLEANPGSSTSARDGERHRAFRIRGNPGAVSVYDERWNPHDLRPRGACMFEDVPQAVAWIAGELMKEPQTENQDQKEVVAMNVSNQGTCPHCGAIHGPRCPYVKAIEYHPSGTIKRVEFFEPKPIVVGSQFEPGPNFIPSTHFNK